MITALLFDMRISSIEASKCKPLHRSMSTTKLTAKKSIQERLLSQERWDSECLPVSIGVCLAAFLSRKDSIKGLEATLIGGVVNESAIVISPPPPPLPPSRSYDRLTRSEVYYTLKMVDQSTGHVQVNKMAL